MKSKSSSARVRALALSRRGMMTSVVALVGLAAATPVEATIKRVLRGRQAAGGGGGGTPTLIGPSGTWVPSTGLSGTTNYDSEVSSTRTKARPIVHLLSANTQRLAANTTFFIAAECFGGISAVRVKGGLATTDLNFPVFVNRLGADGVTKPIREYAFTLDVSAFRAAHGTGNTVKVWIEAIPTNTTLCESRTIGPFTFHPEATDNDGEYYYRKDGAGPGGYTHPQAAFDAAVAAGKLCPKIWCDQSADITDPYPLINTSRSHPWPVGAGRPIWTHSPGVVAWHAKTSGVDLTNLATTEWSPGMDGLEMRGPGIRIDFKWLTSIRTSPGLGGSRPWWWNGAKADNSIGDRDNNYWNRTIHPGFAVFEPSYFTDFDIRNGGTMVGTLLAFQGHIGPCLGDQYSSCPCVYGNSDTDNSTHKITTWFPVDSFGGGGVAGFFENVNIRYTGVGSATIRKTQANGFGSIYITDPASPVTEVEFNLGTLTNLVTCQQLVDWFNARSGWTASVVNDSYPARFIVMTGQGTNGWNTVDATQVHQFLSLLDVHGDWYDYNGYSENLLIKNNRQLGQYNNLSSVIRFDALDDSTRMRDVAVINNLWPVQTSGGAILGPGQQEHMLFRHNGGTFGWGISAIGSYPATCSEFLNNAFYAFEGVIDSSAAYPNIRNNLISAFTPPGPSDGSQFSGNFQAAPGSPFMSAWYTDVVGQDFTPKLGGPMLGTGLRVPSQPDDINGNLRNMAGDAVGAMRA